MKKNFMLGIALVSAVAFVSCGSSESSYKKAYEKAKEQERINGLITPTTNTTPTTTDKPQTTPTITTPQATTNTNIRQEVINVVGNGTIKAYNVVCGSFGSLTNAQNLRNTLANKGYSAMIAQNEKGMYRVIATSTDDRNSAINSRDQLRKTYPDAWLLHRK